MDLHTIFGRLSMSDRLERVRARQAALAPSTLSLRPPPPQAEDELDRSLVPSSPVPRPLSAPSLADVRRLTNQIEVLVARALRCCASHTPQLPPAEVRYLEHLCWATDRAYSVAHHTALDVVPSEASVVGGAVQNGLLDPLAQLQEVGRSGQSPGAAAAAWAWAEEGRLVGWDVQATVVVGLFRSAAAGLSAAVEPASPDDELLLRLLLKALPQTPASVQDRAMVSCGGENPVVMAAQMAERVPRMGGCAFWSVWGEEDAIVGLWKLGPYGGQLPEARMAPQAHLPRRLMADALVDLEREWTSYYQNGRPGGCTRPSKGKGIGS